MVFGVHSALRRSALKMLGAAALAALVLAAGGCTARRASGPVEIRYWTGWTGEELASQRALVAEFNRTHPGIHVKLLCVAGSYQKIPIAIAGGDTPDVCSAVWTDDLYGYAARGALEPLDSYMKAAGRSENELMPGVRKMLHYKGHLFGLAATTNSTLIIYNKDIFRQCGLDPEKYPRTLAELEYAAAKTSQYDNRGAFVRYGFRPGGLLGWGYVFGGRWYDEKTGRVTANDPHNVEALRWMQRWFRKYDIRKMETFEAGQGSAQTANGGFYTGKCAMWEAGEWAEDNIRRYAAKMNWGYFPLPYPPGGREGCVTLAGSVFVMPSACRHKKEAFEFLSWICGPYASARFCTDIHNISPLVEAAKLPVFQNRPITRDAVRLAGGRNAFGPATIPIWPMYQREIQIGRAHV